MSITRQANLRRSRRAALAGVVAAGLLSACAGPESSTPAFSATAASASASAPAVDSPTPLPTLEATTEEADEAPAGAITITMNAPPPRFTPDDVTANAGTVIFFLVNDRDSSEAHNMLIGTDVETPALANSETLLPGHSAVFTVHDLAPGTYAIWCTYNHHVSSGMVGTLTVTR